MTTNGKNLITSNLHKEINSLENWLKNSTEQPGHLRFEMQQRLNNKRNQLHNLSNHKAEACLVKGCLHEVYRLDYCFEHFMLNEIN